MLLDANGRVLGYSDIGQESLAKTGGEVNINALYQALKVAIPMSRPCFGLNSYNTEIKAPSSQCEVVLNKSNTGLACNRADWRFSSERV